MAEVDCRESESLTFNVDDELEEAELINERLENIIRENKAKPFDGKNYMEYKYESINEQKESLDRKTRIG